MTKYFALELVDVNFHANMSFQGFYLQNTAGQIESPLWCSLMLTFSVC